MYKTEPTLTDIMLKLDIIETLLRHPHLVKAYEELEHESQRHDDAFLPDYLYASLIAATKDIETLDFSALRALREKQDKFASIIAHRNTFQNVFMIPLISIILSILANLLYDYIIRR